MSPRHFSRWGVAVLGLAWVCGAWAQAPAAGNTPAAAPAASSTATAPEARVHAGVIKSVQGDVRLERADGRMHPTSPGDVVAQVDRIHTGANSGASLLLRDGTALVLGPQSQLDLTQYHFDATTHDGGMLLSLLHGSMRMVSGLIGRKQPDAVRIDTQTTTIGIRGTDFIVTAYAQP